GASDRRRVGRGAMAGVCLALTLAATVWSAKPLYGPLRREFGWSPWLVAGSGVISMVVTAGLFRRCERAAERYGVRTPATLGCLGAGLVLLLVSPNLTHAWQLAATLVLVGVTRAAVAAATWK